MGIPVGFVFGQSVVCVFEVYFMLAELNEVLDQLRHFVARSVEFRETSVSLLVFALVEAVMSLRRPYWGFFSFTLFIACIVLVAHNIYELQSDREWVENWSVDKDYPQKVTLEIH